MCWLRRLRGVGFLPNQWFGPLGDAMIINKSRVKESAGDFRVSSDFYEALDKVVSEEIKDAKRRADENGRSTLMPHDL